MAERTGVVEPTSPVAHPTARPDRPAARSRLRRAASGTWAVGAVLVVWLALVVPNQLGYLGPRAALSVPLEGLVLLGLALVLPPRARRVTAAVFGALLAVLLVIKVLDIGFFAVFARPVDLLNDGYYLGPGVGVLEDSYGRTPALVVTVLAVVLLVAALSVVPLAAMRVTRLVSDHHPVARLVIGGLAAVWVLGALTGLRPAPGVRVASTSTVGLAVDQVRQLRADVKDRAAFAQVIAKDPYAKTPGNQLLTGLRGKDVLLVFVESYGKVAVQGSSFAPAIDAELDNGTKQLQAAGFSARSAFLKSPTFGAGSWLAHSTMESGAWVDSQQRYGQLMGAQRLTLTSAFRKAGWRTVFDVPADTRDWTQGRDFYGFQQYYDVNNVGYQGPPFSYATIPDQYTLSALHRLELAPQHRTPVYAEVDFVSSHHPWTPLPKFVPWDQVGDGSIYDGMPAQGESPESVFRSQTKVRSAYGKSIEYSLHSLISYLQTYPDPNLVVVMLGDHQPHSYVTGPHPGFDVPVSVIAHDPKVLDAISSWDWQDGLRPAPDAPVWRMDAFRDRFLAAYGPQ
jgi:hypothetical protein